MGITTDYTSKYHLLEKSFLQLNETQTSAGLLRRCAIRRDKNKKLYLSILLQDKNGQIVFGSFFQVDLTESFQREIETMLERVVLVTYTVREFEGQPCLHVSKLEPADSRECYELEKRYFRSMFPEAQQQKLISFVNKQIEGIQNSSIQGFVRSHCVMEELCSCNDIMLYDGMVAAPLSVISTMLVSAGGVFLSQPGFLNALDKDQLIGAIIYYETLSVQMRPLHDFRKGDIAIEILDRIREDERYQLAGGNKDLEIFFRICENVAWSMAGVENTRYTVTEIVLQLHKAAYACHRVVNATHELPKGSIITNFGKNYTR